MFKNCAALFSLSSRCTIRGKVLSPWLICLKRNDGDIIKKYIYTNTTSTFWYFQFFHLTLLLIIRNTVVQPMPVTAWSKASVCDRSLCVIAGSSPAGGMNVCLLWVLCDVRLEVSAKSRPLNQIISTECGVSECDRKASIKRRPWPTRGRCAIGKNTAIDYCIDCNKEKYYSWYMFETSWCED
jgi:hypothetical protein